MFIRDLIVPSEVSQLLIVELGKELITGYLLAYSRLSDDAWTQDLPIIKVAVGKAGMTMHKTEGDNKTPLGLFPLGTGFGRASKTSAMSYTYRQLTPYDKFIDDPEHKEYNSWVSGETDAKSYEVMLREDGLYDLGIVVEYNMHPVVPGCGSAIFIHIWRGKGKGTKGCIAMNRSDLELVLGWLKPDANPHIYIFKE